MIKENSQNFLIDKKERISPWTSSGNRVNRTRQRYLKRPHKYQFDPVKTKEHFKHTKYSNISQRSINLYNYKHQLLFKLYWCPFMFVQYMNLKYTCCWSIYHGLDNIAAPTHSTIFYKTWLYFVWQNQGELYEPK